MALNVDLPGMPAVAIPNNHGYSTPTGNVPGTQSGREQVAVLKIALVDLAPAVGRGTPVIQVKGRRHVDNSMGNSTGVDTAGCGLGRGRLVGTGLGAGIAGARSRIILRAMQAYCRCGGQQYTLFGWCIGKSAWHHRHLPVRCWSSSVLDTPRMATSMGIDLPPVKEYG